MKRKNMLLIVFLLTIFVFQQVQASGVILPVNKSNKMHANSVNANILFDSVHIYVYKLVDGSGAIEVPSTRCVWPDHFGEYGCGDDYPPGTLEPEGFLIVNVEQDYLRDVLATEMNLAQIAPDSDGQALKAQAVASRSVASWKSSIRLN